MLTPYPTEIVPAVKVLFDGGAAKEAKIHAAWQAAGYGANQLFPDNGAPAPSGPVPTIQTVKFGDDECEAEARKLLTVKGTADVGKLNIDWKKVIQFALSILLPLLG